MFYITGLGFTRDPYIDFGTLNMWGIWAISSFICLPTAPRWYAATWA